VTGAVEEMSVREGTAAGRGNAVPGCSDPVAGTEADRLGSLTGRSPAGGEGVVMGRGDPVAGAEAHVDTAGVLDLDRCSALTTASLTASI
jgi:hypothetical protein